MLLLMRAARRAPQSGSLSADADALYAKILAAYVSGRASAAYVGAGSARAELALLAPGLDLGALRAAPDLVEEARRANRAARGYVKRWLDKARKLEAAGADLPGPAARAAVAAAAETGAAFESAEAFNAARAETIAKAVRENPALVHVVEQVWDAELDKRTCDRCAALDGTTAPLDGRFPDGDPPLHMRCRCTISLKPKG